MKEFKCSRPMNIKELKEIMKLMELQETTDLFTDTSLNILGDDSCITVNIDSEGNVILL